MKKIYIIRHAKSSWEYENIKDIDRPLKERGIQDAYLIAKILKNKIPKPNAFLTSSANRALSTAIIFANVFNFAMSNLYIKKELYDFSDKYLIKTIKALDDAYNSVFIFSHDHGINDFVNCFGNEAILHVPTCGVIGIGFKIKHWKNIKYGTTFLKEFPKFHRDSDK